MKLLVCCEERRGITDWYIRPQLCKEKKNEECWTYSKQYQKVKYLPWKHKTKKYIYTKNKQAKICCYKSDFLSWCWRLHLYKKKKTEEKRQERKTRKNRLLRHNLKYLLGPKSTHKSFYPQLNRIKCTVLNTVNRMGFKSDTASSQYIWFSLRTKHMFIGQLQIQTLVTD